MASSAFTRDGLDERDRPPPRLAAELDGAREIISSAKRTETVDAVSEVVR